MGGVTTPRKEGVDTGRQGSDEQQASKRAARKGNKQSNKDSYCGSNDDDTPPLFEEAAPG